MFKINIFKKIKILMRLFKSKKSTIFVAFNKSVLKSFQIFKKKGFELDVVNFDIYLMYLCSYIIKKLKLE